MAMNLIVAALERGPRRPVDALVLIAICDSADKVSGEAWPSLATLAEAARCTPRAVRLVLSRLVAEGWLTIERRHRANGSQASNLYRVNLAMLGEERGRGAEPGSSHGGERGSPLEPSHQKEPCAREGSRGATARRLPPDGGGAPSLPEGFDVGTLTAFERSLVQGGRSLVVAGALVKPGSPAFQALALAVRECVA